jgi:hypothetical protein
MPPSFAPLFRHAAAKDYIDALSELQSTLGHLNDMIAATRLIDELWPPRGRQYRFRVRRASFAVGPRQWRARARTPAQVPGGNSPAKPFWN